MRVAFLTNFVSPYRLPLFRELADSGDWDLHVVVNADTEFDRKWDVDVGDLKVVPTKSIRRRNVVQHEKPIRYEEVLTQYLPTGLWSDLRRIKPDVIITGEMGPRSIVATLYGMVHRVPVVLWSYHSRTSQRRSPLKTRIWRWMLRRSAAIVGMGTQAREVLAELGAPDGKIHDAWNSTDTANIDRRVQTDEHAKAVAAIREKYADGKRLMVVIGRLVPLKGIPETRDAWLALPEDVRATSRLVFVGDGPLKPMVEGLEDSGIEVIGHVTPAETVDWYRAADVHLFASLGDVWGLVVNESLYCGTATLSSIHAGATEDLIQPGETGLTFDPTDQPAFTAALEDALTRDDLDQLAAGGHESGKSCSVQRMAQGFREAVDSIDRLAA